MKVSYVLPIRLSAIDRRAIEDLTCYLRTLADVDLIVVDDSPPEVFEAHHAAWISIARHVPVDPALTARNGKVRGVLTGIALARYEPVIIADNDVRYDYPNLAAVTQALRDVHVVRPQNYFDPLPWHARWDTARTLLNRALDGDWPGTIGVRRSTMERCGGYDGNVLFENFELVRTVRAAGGVELVARDIFVRRLPPTTGHFFSQRVRQAYDEFARPWRLGLALSLGPAAIFLWTRRRFDYLIVLASLSVCLAEFGRRRAGGRRVFPATSALWAPAWVAERALTSWIALALRISGRGIVYSGVHIVQASTRRRSEERAA